MQAKQTRVITFGSFDLFHIGHLKLLERAKALGDTLFVGVSSDSFHFFKRKQQSICKEKERMAIVEALRVVDGVFLEESFEKKREYILQHKADILVMGDDWKDKFDEFQDICQVVYLPRTPNVSTTQIKTHITSKERLANLPKEPLKPL